MASVRYINVVVRVDDAGATAKLRELSDQANKTQAAFGPRFGRAMTSAGYAMRDAGRMITMASGAMAGIGYYAAKAAVDFNSSMTRIQTQAGASAKDVRQMTKAVLDFAAAGKSAFKPNELADALYHIASVGIRQAAPAMKVLKAATDLAGMSGANLEDTATAIASVMVTTHAPVSRLAQIQGVLNAAVGQGNIRMADLNTALGRGLIPAFQSVGLNMRDALGALDVFTDSGIKASSAAAQVSTALHYLVKPSKEAQKYLQLIGMTPFQMAEDLHKPRGLLVTLKDLKAHLDTLPGGIKGVDAGIILNSIFPAGRGRIMTVLLQNLDRYKNKLDGIDKSVKTVGQDVQTYHETPAYKFAAAWASIHAALIKFGAAILPIIQKYLPTLTKDIMDVVKWFTGLPKGVQAWIVKLTLLGLVLGPVLTALGTMLTIVGRLTTAYYALAGGEGAAGAAARGAFGKFGPLLTRLGLIAGAAVAAQLALQKITGPGHAAGAGPGAVPKGSPTDIITQHQAQGTSTLSKILHWSLGIRNAPANLFHSIFGQHGGIVPMTHPYVPGRDTVPAMLQPGEGVLTRSQMANIGSSGFASLTSGAPFPVTGTLVAEAPIVIALDGRELTRAVVRYTLKKAARGPANLTGGSLMVGASSPVSHG